MSKSLHSSALAFRSSRSRGKTAMKVSDNSSRATARVSKKRNWGDISKQVGNDVSGADVYPKLCNSENSSETEIIDSFEEEDGVCKVSKTTTTTHPVTSPHTAAMSDVGYISDEDQEFIEDFEVSYHKDVQISKLVQHDEANVRIDKKNLKIGQNDVSLTRVMQNEEEKVLLNNVLEDEEEQQSVYDSSDEDLFGDESDDEDEGVESESYEDETLCEGKRVPRPTVTKLGKWACAARGCDKVLSSKGNWKVHYAAVHLNKRYRCDQDDCDKNYAGRKALDMHLFLAHGIGEPAKKNPRMSRKRPKSNLREFKCEYDGCDKVYRHKGNLQTHILTIHEEVRYPCTVEGCGAVFKGVSGLWQHRRSKHEGIRVPCMMEGCTKTFNDKSNLHQHIRSAHKGTRYKCTHPGCDKSYTQKAHVEEHVKRVHEQRVYECPVPDCGKEYKTSCSYVTHFRRDHPDLTYEAAKVTENGRPVQ